MTRLAGIGLGFALGALSAAAQGNILPPGNYGMNGNQLMVTDTTATTATLTCTPGNYWVGNSPPVETLLENYIVKVSPVAPVGWPGPAAQLADWFDNVAFAAPMTWVGTPVWDQVATFQVTGLTPSTAYYVAIAGFDDAGNRSAIMDVWNFTSGLVTAPAPPPSPTPTPSPSALPDVAVPDGVDSTCSAGVPSGAALFLLVLIAVAPFRVRHFSGAGVGVHRADLVTTGT